MGEQSTMSSKSAGGQQAVCGRAARERAIYDLRASREGRTSCGLPASCGLLVNCVRQARLTAINGRGLRGSRAADGDVGEARASCATVRGWCYVRCCGYRLYCGAAAVYGRCYGSCGHVCGLELLQKEMWLREVLRLRAILHDGNATTVAVLRLLRERVRRLRAVLCPRDVLWLWVMLWLRAVLRLLRARVRRLRAVMQILRHRPT